MTLAIVCGMASEAAIINEVLPGQSCIIGAGDTASLSSKIKAVIANGASRIISIGICGGLAPDLNAGDIVIGSSVVYGLSQFSTDMIWSQYLHDILKAKLVKFTWSDTIIARLADKTALYKATHADVVDEETFIVGSLAVTSNLPFTALRVVCDPPWFELPSAACIDLTADGKNNIASIITSIVTNPLQIPKLIELAGLSTTAMNNLKRALIQVGNNI